MSKKIRSLTEAYDAVCNENMLGDLKYGAQKIGILNQDEDFVSRRRSEDYENSVKSQAEEKAKQKGVDNNNEVLDYVRGYLEDVSNKYSEKYPLWPKIQQELLSVLNKYRK